jgi:multiple sugar transport system permease protein
MKTRVSPLLLVWYAVMVLLAIPFLFPTLWMLSASFKTGAEIFANPLALWPSSLNWGNIQEVFENYPFASQYWNSTYIATLVTLLTMFLAALAGYGFARLSFPGRDVLFVVCLSAMMLPAEALAIPQFVLFKTTGLSSTHLPIILLQIFGSTGALAVFLMRQHFLGLPKELDEAALMDGLGRWGIFWYILLPLSKPALTAVGIFAFLNSWNDYFNPLVYLNQAQQFTIPLALQNFTDPLGGVFWHLTLTASSLATLPLLLAFLVAQRQFVESLTSSGIKG